MNKLLKGLVCLSAGAVLACTSCSSHHHDCAPMDEIVGIYKLTTCEWTNLEDSNVKVNEMTTYNILGYLVVTGDQYGYAYYKDDETTERFTYVNLQYGLDDEESTDENPMYTYVEYNWTHSTGHCRNTMYHPGYNEPQLGVQRKSHKLTYASAKQQKNIFDSSKGYYNRLYVEYTRISSKTTFADFKQETGLDLEKPVLPEIPQE